MAHGMLDCLLWDAGQLHHSFQSSESEFHGQLFEPLLQAGLLALLRRLGHELAKDVRRAGLLGRDQQGCAQLEAVVCVVLRPARATRRHSCQTPNLEPDTFYGVISRAKWVILDSLSTEVQVTNTL